MMPMKGNLKAQTSPEAVTSPKSSENKSAKRSITSTSSSTSTSRQSIRSVRSPKARKLSRISTGSSSRLSSTNKARVAPVHASNIIKEKPSFKSISLKVVKFSTKPNAKSGKNRRRKILLKKTLSNSLARDVDSIIPTLYVDIAETTQVFLKMVMAVTGLKNEPKRGNMVQYEILDETRKKILTAEEVSGFTGGSRPFQLTLSDLNEKVVFTVQRRGNASLCFLGSKCYGSNATIKARSTEAEALTTIGSIRQKCDRGMLKYEAFDNKGKNIMNIYGPKQRYWYKNCVGIDASFQIFSTAEPELLGVLRVFSAPATFGSDPFVLSVEFPLELRPEYKIIILGVAALVNLSFFDTKHGFNLYGNVFFLLIILVLICGSIFVFGFILY